MGQRDSFWTRSPRAAEPLRGVPAPSPRRARWRIDLCDDQLVTTRRWETDARGHGIASGEAFAGNVRDLAAMMADPDWVAEDPEAHLLPHLQAACAAPSSDLRLAR